MPQLTFVGTGEAFDPALPNTSLLYQGSETLLIDCGFAVPHAFWKISRDPSLLDAIYISHLHADHSFGLPALLLWMREAGRTRPLKVIGGGGVGAWLSRLLELGYPGSYAPDHCFEIQALELLPGSQLALGEAVLSNAQSEHGVRNLSLRIDEAGRAFAYSGDGRPTEATRALFRDAALLVHECYSLDREFPGHASFTSLLKMTRDGSVARLALLHLGRGERAEIVTAAFDNPTPPQLFVPAPGDVTQI